MKSKLAEKPLKPLRSIIEAFGHSPYDLSPEVRMLWNLGACPFTNSKCIKTNSDRTITYGTCSVSNRDSSVIICPNRFYANDYKVLKDIASNRFGHLPFYLFGDYIRDRVEIFSGDSPCVVALGRHSGKEVQVAGMSMDWILAVVHKGELVEYLGIEVQSLDITGNYRDNWNSFNSLKDDPVTEISPSNHGLNWANVRKRLMPQLISKGNLYAQSEYVKNGIHFVAPEAVYKKFEEIIGPIPYQDKPSQETMTVRTYELGPEKEAGEQRDLIFRREIHFLLKDFSERFIRTAEVDIAEELNNRIKNTLGVQ